MTGPRIKPSRDPKAIYDACKVAAGSGGGNIKEKTDHCTNEVLGSPHFPNLLSALQNVTCMDSHEGAGARGQCLADAIWPARKAYTKTYLPVSPGFFNGYSLVPTKPPFNSRNLFPHLGPIESSIPDVTFTVKFPFGQEETYSYTQFNKDGKALTLEEAKKVGQEFRSSGEIYFNCQNGTPDIVGSFISRGGSCKKPLIVLGVYHQEYYSNPHYSSVRMYVERHSLLMDGIEIKFRF